MMLTFQEKLIEGAKLNNSQMILECFVYGLDINQTVDPEHHCTALHWAAMQGSIEAIAFLLFLGANPDIQDRYGWTPLHQAVRNVLHNADQSGESKQMLIRAGCNPDIKNNTGETALQVGQNYNPGVVPCISTNLDYRASCQRQMFDAVKQNDIQKMIELLSNHRNISHSFDSNEHHFTPLHKAALQGYKEAVIALG